MGSLATCLIFLIMKNIRVSTKVNRCRWMGTGSTRPLSVSPHNCLLFISWAHAFHRRHAHGFRSNSLKRSQEGVQRRRWLQFIIRLDDEVIGTLLWWAYPWRMLNAVNGFPPTSSWHPYSCITTWPAMIFRNVVLMESILHHVCYFDLHEWVL